jgi:hypothetical protein
MICNKAKKAPITFVVEPLFASAYFSKKIESVLQTQQANCDQYYSK